MNDPVTPLVLILGGGASLFLMGGAAPPFGTRSSASRDTAPAMVECLRSAEVLAEASSNAWPGFRLSDQVIIVASERTGPVVLAGDSAPPPEYKRAGLDGAVFARQGAPPDSLLGLRVAIDWNGRRGDATVVPFNQSACVRMVIHESFHTYQRVVWNRDHSRFSVWGGNMSFPDTVTETVTMLLVEGRSLAAALAASSAVERRVAIRRALAARIRRCKLVGVSECGREREVELLEGSAEYTAQAALGESGCIGRRSAIRDSLRFHLLAVQDLNQLGRNYLYWTGASWILLGSEGAPPAWQEAVEKGKIDVLAERLAGRPGADADAIARSRAFLTTAATARADAERLIAREHLRSNSASRAFWSQPGVAVKVYWTSVNGLRAHERTGPNVENEFSLRFPSNGGFLTIRGLFQKSCCPNAVVAIIPREDLSISVNGRSVAAGTSPQSQSGTVEVHARGVDLRHNAAQLEVRGDTVTIRLGLPKVR